MEGMDGIFIWEDICKPVNRLDMMLTHFRDVGVFDNLKGMIVGELVSCEPSDNVSCEEMLLDLLSDYNFPILTGVSFGHTPVKLTLPIGSIASGSTGQTLKLHLGEI